MYGQGYGFAGSIQSHFLDLAKCPNGVVSTQPRNCPGADPSNNPSNVTAGGQIFEFTGGSSGQALWFVNQLLLDYGMYTMTIS